MTDVWTTLLDFILEMAAVFVGVFAAFWLDNRRERKAEDKERVRLLGLIRREVEANQQIISGMTAIDAGRVLNAGPIHTIWDEIPSKLAVLSNDDLLHEATVVYFDLANFEKNIDMYDEYARRYQYATEEEKTKMKPELERQCVHLKGFGTKIVLPQITKVLGLIDAELSPEKIVRVTKSNTQT